MTIESGVGLSTNKDLLSAAKEAAQEARATCPEPKLVLFLCTFNYPLDDLLPAGRALAEAFPNAKIAGGTVNGLTYSNMRYDALFANNFAAAVVTFGGSSMSVGVALSAAPNNDAKELGKRLVTEARQGMSGPAEGGIIFTPGFGAGMAFCDQEIVDGVRAGEPRLRVSGTGLAGGMRPDGVALPGTAFLGDRAEKMGSLLVVFTGGRFGFSVANGMTPLEGGAFVTDAQGMMIRTLNGRPASEVAVELLSRGDPEATEHFMKNPSISCVERGVSLGLADPEGDFFWSHGPAFFTPDKAMVDFFSAKKGTALTLVAIDPKSCMSAVQQAAEMLGNDAGTEDFEFVMAFSCALRGFTLGGEVAHEDTELKNHIKTRKQLGIVANGEIGCHRQGRPFATSWVYALFGLAGGR